MRSKTQGEGIPDESNALRVAWGLGPHMPRISEDPQIQPEPEVRVQNPAPNSEQLSDQIDQAATEVARMRQMRQDRTRSDAANQMLNEEGQ